MSENAAPSSMTHFERLGLPQRYALDSSAIEKSYLERSRTLHPDYHQLAATSQQQVSLTLTAALNDAYATLKHPFRRAEYLLTLEGGHSASEHKEMAPAFLEEMLELRMEIEELRMDSAPGSPKRVALEEQLEQRQDRLIEDVAQGFARLESADPSSADRKAILLGIRQTLNSAKYIQGLLRDLRAD